MEEARMSDQFSNLQQIRKPAVVSKGGIVAAQSQSREIGAEVLAAGGDCVDAVVATGFALGVLEPWMSGLGGGGAMVLYRAREDRYEVIDYACARRSASILRDYPRTAMAARPPTSSPGRGSRTTAICAARVRSRCPVSPPAWTKPIAATPDCRGRPALARGQAGRRGLLVDWWTTIMISSSAADLRRYRRAAPPSLDGLPPNPQWSVSPICACRRHRLKATLEHLAATGPRDFYEGDLAQKHRRRRAGRRRHAGRPRTSPRSVLMCASRSKSLSRRHGLRDAGTDLRPDPGARAAPVAAGTGAFPHRPGCIGLCRYAQAVQSPIASA